MEIQFENYCKKRIKNYYHWRSNRRQVYAIKKLVEIIYKKLNLLFQQILIQN